MGTPPSPTPPSFTSGAVDATIKAIGQLGFPIVVAAFLLWFLLTGFKTAIEQVTLRMERNAVAVDAMLEAMKGQESQLRQQTDELRKQSEYLRAMTDRMGPRP